MRSSSTAQLCLAPNLLPLQNPVAKLVVPTIKTPRIFLFLFCWSSRSPYFLLVVLKQQSLLLHSLTAQPRHPLTLQPSCLSLPDSETAGACHHTQFDSCVFPCTLTPQPLIRTLNPLKDNFQSSTTFFPSVKDALLGLLYLL